MKKQNYSIFMYARNNNDLNLMKNLYEKNKNDLIIKLNYAKMLIKNGKKEEGRKLLEELLSTYIKCYALLELGRLEALDGDKDYAKIYLNKLLNTPSRQLGLLELGKLEINDGNFDVARAYFYAGLCNSRSSKELELFYNNIILCYIEEGNNVDALKLLNQMLKKNLNTDSRFLFYLCNKLNVSLEEYGKGYKESEQSLDYDKAGALKHIIDNYSDFSKSSKTKFNSDIDIYRLFYDIKGMLTEETIIARTDAYDVYVVPYWKVGSKGEDFVKVITLPKLKDIITMFPINNQMGIEEKTQSK